jgi:hypothetical protein
MDRQFFDPSILGVVPATRSKSLNRVSEVEIALQA